MQPTFAVAWSNLAGLFMDSGDLNKALHYYKVCRFFFTSMFLLLFLSCPCVVIFIVLLAKDMA